VRKATSLSYLRGDKAIDPDRPRILQATEWQEDKMDEKKLWAFLEKWTRPNDDYAMVQWKKELDEVFL
jgi:hypothetical protein